MKAQTKVIIKSVTSFEKEPVIPVIMILYAFIALGSAFSYKSTVAEKIVTDCTGTSINYIVKFFVSSSYKRIKIPERFVHIVFPELFSGIYPVTVIIQTCKRKT